MKNQSAIYAEQETVKNQDWRLHAVTAISEDAGNFKRGDIIKAAMPLHLNDGSILNAGAPNIEALLLDFAAKLDEETKNLVSDLKAALASGANVFDQIVFDGIEKRMASAIFAFTAIETFANEVIALAYSKGYQHQQKQKSRLIAVLSLEDAQWLQIDEKLAQVLPTYLSIQSPKGTKYWEAFKRLKKIRNRIIHLKGVDRGNSTDRWLWEELLKPKGWHFSAQVHELIGYFSPHIKELNFRWHSKWPYEAKSTSEV